MTQPRRLLLLVCMMAFASVPLAGSTTPASMKFACADFLDILHLKPPHALFIGCEWDRNRQGKPQRATYRVAGIHAVTVESFLVRTAHFSRLRKSCCQWDGTPSQLTGKDGHTYTIYMTSPETSVKSRKHWRNIPAFEIAVETLTEDI